MSARDDYPRAPLTQATYEAMCDEIDRLRTALNRAREAIRLTREYVDPGCYDPQPSLLPPIEGWSWYDAVVMIDEILGDTSEWATMVRTGRLSERDPSEQVVPRDNPEPMDFGREDIIGFAIDGKWHPTPGGL